MAQLHAPTEPWLADYNRHATFFPGSVRAERLCAFDPTHPCHMVYVLQGDAGGYYIGCTKNLPKRLAEHRSGSTEGSRRLGDPKRLAYIHAWHVPDAFSGDLLETFAWRFHQAFGIRRLIELSPHWSSELRAAAASITPTEYEMQHKYVKPKQAKAAKC